jgi:tetratricopeptide (TPR) repeat protein
LKTLKTKPQAEKHSNWRVLTLAVACSIVMQGCAHNPQAPIVVSQQQADNAQNLIYQAIAALGDGDFASAINTCSAALALNPNAELAYICRGYALFKVHKSAEAVTDFGKAAEINPGDYQCYEYRAAAYEALKRYRKAIADYRLAIGKAPNNIQLKTKLNQELALCYLSFGEMEAAAATFSNAITLSPTNSMLYVGRAMADLHLSLLDKCVADASEGISLDPHNATAFHVRARAYAALSKSALSGNDEAYARRLYNDQLSGKNAGQASQYTPPK